MNQLAEHTTPFLQRHVRIGIYSFYHEANQYRFHHGTYRSSIPLTCYPFDYRPPQRQFVTDIYSQRVIPSSMNSKSSLLPMPHDRDLEAQTASGGGGSRAASFSTANLSKSASHISLTQHGEELSSSSADAAHAESSEVDATGAPNSTTQPEVFLHFLRRSFAT